MRGEKAAAWQREAGGAKAPAEGMKGAGKRMVPGGHEQDTRG